MLGNAVPGTSAPRVLHNKMGLREEQEDSPSEGLHPWAAGTAQPGLPDPLLEGCFRPCLGDAIAAVSLWAAEFGFQPD